MDLRDIQGYGKIIRNGQDFPDDCISDDQRKSFLNRWFFECCKLAAIDPKSHIRPFGRREDRLYFAGRKCADGSGGLYIYISPRHNRGELIPGMCPEEIFMEARQLAEQTWKKPISKAEKGLIQELRDR